MPAQVKCPTCRKEVPWENNPHRPFCSDRCKILDLGAWSQERYRIPAEATEFDPDAEDETTKERN